MPAQRPQDMMLWAWVGEDDAPGANNGDFGLKQGIVPAGCIPLVACTEGKLDRHELREQMELLAKHTGKRRYLVRFKFDAIVEEIPAARQEGT